MITGAAPSGFRQKTKILYKQSIVMKIMGVSACLALTSFLMAIVYYTVLLEGAAETALYDCGGGTCKDLYKSLTGCAWGDFYADKFKFTTVDDNGSSDDSTGGSSDSTGGSGDRRRLAQKIREADDFSVADKEFLENLAVHGGMRRVLAESNCEPKDGGNYWVIAGQHYAAGAAIENILVQLKRKGDDLWSVINLSWTAATLTWTLSSVAFSLILPWCGESLLNPDVVKEMELEGSDNLEMVTSKLDALTE